MAVSLELEKAVGDPVMGIDEAGRGPLAGGVYAAAVSVPLALAEQLLVGAWSEINDSKKLTEKKRERLAAVIKSTDGCRWAVASASPKEIDELNILNATHLAMRRAANEVGAEHVLVDGLPVKTLPHAVNVVKGDAKSLLIAAAMVTAVAMAIAALVARHAGNRWFVDSIQTGSAAPSPRFLFSGA